MRITTISLFIIIHIFFSVIQTNSKPVINELMAVPTDGEPEWIEIYNNSNNEYNLLNYVISDASTSKKLAEIILFPGEFLVLVKDTNLLKTYRVIPQNSKLIQLTIPTLNNTTDVVKLYDNNGELIDSCYYDMKWGESGKSLERIDPNSPALDKNHWSKSIHISGATPGEINSSIRLDYDYSIVGSTINDDFTQLQINIQNLGAKSDGEFNLILCISDIGLDNLSSKLLDLRNQKLFGSDTLYLFDINDIKKNISKNGTYTITAYISSANDNRFVNDTSKIKLYFRITHPNVRINEIMYDVSSGIAEYIEIWNADNDTVLFNEIVVWDAAGSLYSGNIRIPDQGFVIPPNGYGIICWDSIFFENYPDLKGHKSVVCSKSSLNLNLSGDLIVTSDINGRIYDSLVYSDNWHSKSVIETKNRSLEKINPDLNGSEPSSWSTCANLKGGTPLQKNSLTGESINGANINISPNPFAPGSGGSDANALIFCELPFKTSNVNAYIYDNNGFCVFRLANNRYIAGSVTFVWDGTNQERYFVQPGQYVFVVESTDTETGQVFSDKTLIVVGR